jgi:hypothetical protein
MSQDRQLIEAWAGLVLLSVGTTLITLYELSPQRRWAVAATVLGLAGLKARIILGRYLGLKQSKFWMHLFDAAIVLFMAIAMTLYLLGAGG